MYFLVLVGVILFFSLSVYGFSTAISMFKLGGIKGIILGIGCLLTTAAYTGGGIIAFIKQ